jgi:hypothetical protein
MTQTQEIRIEVFNLTREADKEGEWLKSYQRESCQEYFTSFLQYWHDWLYQDEETAIRAGINKYYDYIRQGYTKAIFAVNEDNVAVAYEVI